METLSYFFLYHLASPGVEPNLAQVKAGLPLHHIGMPPYHKSLPRQPSGKKSPYSLLPTPRNSKSG